MGGFQRARESQEPQACSLLACVDTQPVALSATRVHAPTGFALVGGPARQDAPKAIEALKALNVPYLVSLPLVFQTTEEWLGSELGVHPVQVALQVRG